MKTIVFRVLQMPSRWHSQRVLFTFISSPERADITGAFADVCDAVTLSNPLTELTWTVASTPNVIV